MPVGLPDGRSPASGPPAKPAHIERAQDDVNWAYICICDNKRRYSCHRSLKPVDINRFVLLRGVTLTGAVQLYFV